MKMQGTTANSTLSFIDLSINKSIDFIATTIHQLLQLIFCLVSIMVVGKIVSFFVSKTSPAENIEENVKADVEPEPEKDAEKPEKEPSGWDSEPISDDPLPPPLEILSSNVTAKVMKKQFRRKCISVGPIMLTPNSKSQIIRTLNVEEREERYRYDILPLDTTPKEDATTAENVQCGECVPCAFVLANRRCVINFLTYKFLDCVCEEFFCMKNKGGGGLKCFQAQDSLLINRQTLFLLLP